MGIPISSNFNLQAQLALDERTIKADLTARDAIASGQRVEGLAVYITATKETYQLQGGITNSDWVLITSLPLSTEPGNIIVNNNGIYSSGTLREGIISGGIVTWIANYNYNVSAATYRIGDIVYNSPSANITLVPSSDTLDRIDTFILDINSVATVLTGVPSATPTSSNIDQTSQLAIGITLIVHSSTSPQPPINQQYIYRENTEWITTTPNPSTVDFNYTTAPIMGAKSVKFTNATLNHQARFTYPTPSPISPTYNTLILDISTGGLTWAATSVMNIAFYNGNSQVGVRAYITNTKYGFNRVSSSTQRIVIPVSDFGIGTSNITSVLFFVSVSAGSTMNCIIDNIQLQGAVIPVVPNSGTVTSVGLTSSDITIGGSPSPITSSGDYTLTLPTVNSSVGSFTNANLTVNAKGQVTAASNGSGGGVPSFQQVTDIGSYTTNNFGITRDLTQVDGMIYTPLNFYIGADSKSHIGFQIFDTDPSYTATIDGNGVSPYSGGMMYWPSNAVSFYPWPTFTYAAVGINGIFADQTGVIRLGNTLEPTPSDWVLSIDANDNIWKKPITDFSGGGGGTTYTSSNGITLSGSNFTLGGTLISDTTINNSIYKLSVSGTSASYSPVVDISSTSSSGRALAATAIGGAAIIAISNTGAGIASISNYGNAIEADSPNGSCLIANSSSAPTIIASSASGPGISLNTGENTTTIDPIIVLTRRIVGGAPAAPGIGVSIDMTINHTSSTGNTSNRIISKWTDPSSATRTSEFSISGVDNTVTNTLLKLQGSGQAELPKYGLGTFTNTATYLLGVDASGEVIEVALSSGGGGGGGVTGGVNNYLARWTGASTLSTGLIQDNNSLVTIGGSTVVNGTSGPVSNVARGLYINPTLTTTANNQIQAALEIDPILQNSDGGINSIVFNNGNVPGSYTPGTYTNINLTGGVAGVNAKVTLIVGAGGSITNVTLTSRGSGFILNEGININNPDIGGIGSTGIGFTFDVGYTNLSQLAIKQTKGDNKFNQVSGASYFGTTSTTYPTQLPAGDAVLNAACSQGGMPLSLRSGTNLTRIGGVTSGFNTGNITPIYGIYMNGVWLGNQAGKFVIGTDGNNGIDMYTSYTQSIAPFKLFTSGNMYLGSSVSTDGGDKLKIEDGRVVITSNPAINTGLNISTAGLMLNSTTQGVVLSRVTDAQRDGFNRVSLIAVSAGGTGYTGNPTVTITGGGGTGATATALVYYYVTSLTFTPGSGYVTPPSVIISNAAPGSPSYGTATISGGAITSVSFAGYALSTNTGLTITVSGGGGTGGSATVTGTDGRLSILTVTNGGKNYTSNPTISITGAGGTGAVGTPTISTILPGTMVFCTDKVAADGSTGVAQVYNGTIWKDTISAPGGGGGGGVSIVSVVSSNGFNGTVATNTSTPAITLSTTVTGMLKGNGTAISAATAGTDYQSPITLTTTGSSGSATLIGNTLNIPSYSGGGGGGVSTVSVVSANGLAGTVASATTTPAITLTTTITGIVKGNGTAFSAATAGTDYVVPSGSITGNAATVTTNANLTGNVTSVGNATTIANNVVTVAKMQTIATQTLLGRGTAATGNVEVITLGNDLSIVSGILNSTSVIKLTAGGGNTATYTIPIGMLVQKIIPVPSTTQSISANYTAGTAGDIFGVESVTNEGTVFNVDLFSATTAKDITIVGIPSGNFVYLVIKQII